MGDSPLQNARILIVDDQATNVMLLESLLEEWGYHNVISTTDSSEVVRLVEQTNPDLLLLDLVMPDPDGFAVMEQLQPWTTRTAYLPILVLTGDTSTETKQRALAAGARDFLGKLFDQVEARLRIENLLHTRSAVLELEAQAEVLEHRVRARTRDLERARFEVLERLGVAAEFRDDDTHEHAQRVGRTSGALAERLGQPSPAVELIRLAAPLHDVGKIGIPDTILLKPGKLTEDEYALMTTHSTLGARILGNSGSPVLQLAEQIARTHHERWDGSGYPAGLAAEDIPLPGRIVSVADTFDALTHRRPYKEAWPLAQALEEVRRVAGSELDPAAVEAFCELDHEQLLAPIQGLRSA